MTARASQLVDALRRSRGDTELWGMFYRHMHATVFYTAYRLAQGQHAAAEDITQEAFLRFFENANLDEIPDDEHAAAYLRQVARNLFRDRMRSAESKNISLSELPEYSTGIYYEEDQNQLLIDIERLASGLNEAERTLLQDLLAGLSPAEIALKEGTSHGAIRLRTHRLRKKLAETMS